MKISKKYRQTIKKRLLTSVSSVATVLMLVAGTKLAGFSAPEIKQIGINARNYIGTVLTAESTASNSTTSTETATTIGKEYDFDYTGSVQTFTAPFTGYYQIECWGASGGRNINTAWGSRYWSNFGNGGYSSGIIKLHKDKTIYIYVGQQGCDGTNSAYKLTNTSFNGGGAGCGSSDVDDGGGAGGGATDIRLVNGNWNNFESLKSRIMVAGGGSGSAVIDPSFTARAGGSGGGISATGSVWKYQNIQISNHSYNATQTTGYKFGIGENGVTAGRAGGAGAGGGYYGGYSSKDSPAGGAGGGSGYVSGHEGCDAISEESTESNIIHTGQKNHFSGYIFSNTKLIDGNSSIPTHDGTSTMTGNSGNGYAKITSIREASTDNTLGQLKLKYGDEEHTINLGEQDVLDKVLNNNDNEYSFEVPSDDIQISINLSANDSSATVEGEGTFDLKPGITTIKLKVIAENDDERIITLNVKRQVSSNSYLKNITIGGKDLEGFEATKLNYNINLLYSEDLNTSITAEKSLDLQTVEGEGTYEINYDEKLVTLKVTAEDGVTTSIYNLYLKRVDTTLLKSCTIKDNDDFGNKFDSNTFDYDYEVTSGNVSLNITATPYDPDCSVKITGAGYLKEGKNTVTITVSKEGLETSIYTINVTRDEENETQEFKYPYSGNVQTFIAPVTGYYQIECWGASGGRNISWEDKYWSNFGNGGYSSGIIKLNKDEKLYIYVGQQGSDGTNSAYKLTNTSFNGGGAGCGSSDQDDGGGAGGGATDIRLVNGNWNNFESLKSRIMVAGGGSGSVVVGRSFTSRAGGSGGGISATGSIWKYEDIQISNHSYNATQTTGYKFGIGENGVTAGRAGGAGAGGGYYGGYSSKDSPAGGAGGGSGYVSGYEGCDSISEESTESNIIHTGQSVHYSGLKFKNASMISGNQSVPTYDGTNVMTGNTGNGYAKITLMKEPSNDALLKQLQVSYGTEEHTINIGDQDILDKAFSYDDTEYTINVASDVTKLTLYGIQDHIAATVDGNGTYDIKSGTNTITLKVTAENEDVKTYTINVVRDASSNSKPDNIKINGIIDAFIKEGSDYGKLKNTATGEETEFSPDIHEYSMTLPARQKKISFDVTKGHDYETVVGDGEYTLQDNDNTFTIKITSEDGTSTSEYKYNIFHDMTGNCLLSELHVTNIEKDIDFEQETLEYYITVPNDTDHLDITAVPESNKATVKIIGADSLTIGLNEVYVIVNAEDGEQLVYVIHTYRMKSGNTFIKSLKITGLDGDKKDQELTYTPEFNKIYEDYIVETVPNNVTKINISAETEETTTKISGNGVQNLKSGINVFKLTTTAEDGTNGTYTIKIEREKSANNYLSTLSADEGDFIKESSETTDTTSDSSTTTTEKQEFDKETLNYNMEVSSDVSSLNLHYATEDSTATVRIEGNSNFKAGGNIVKIIVTAENGDERTYVISVEKAKSTNNNLKALWTDKGTLNPTFDKDTTEYNVEVENDVENITVSATKDDLRSTITGTGTYALEVGKNTIEVKVTSESGDEKTYTINVNRKKNSNAYLSSLTLKKGQNTITISPEFNKETAEYTANVPYTYYNINVNAEPEASTTTVSGDGKHDLEQGENTIVVTATAEDGTTKDYTIKVTRVAPGVDVDKLSDEARLSNLALKTGSFTTSFDKDTYTYYTTTEDSSLDLIVTPMEKNATYEIKGNENFVKGTNEVTIEVTSPSGKVTKTYTIVVTKTASSNNNLEYIKVIGYELSPEFNRSTTYYEVSVPEEIKTVVVTAKPEDETSTVTGTGKVSLKPGKNTVTITVTSESGRVKTYTVVINKPASSNNNLINLDVSKGTLTPTFDKDTTSYKVTLPYEENTIDVIANIEDDTATVTGNGNYKLNVGLNTIKVNVTAQNGSIKTYEIDVTRKTAVSALLKNLEVKNYDISPKFDSNTLEYAVTVDNEVTSLSLTTETLDPGATVEITGNENFKVGLNQVNIKVTSSDGSKTETYTIDVTRQVYANNFLSYIMLSSGTLTPKFDKTNLTYTAEVEAETESITIEAEPEDSSATLTGTGTFSLNKGENWFKLVVTSKTGISRTYRVKVTRKQSSNNYLKDLKVSVSSQLQEITPTFNKNTSAYEVTVPAGTTLAYIDATPEDETASIGGAGYVQISSTKTVQNIVVYAENGDTRTYTLTINREPSTVCDLADLIPSSGVLDPSFSYDTTEYSLELGNADDYLSFTVSKIDENSTVSGIKKQSVPDGESTRIIVVTAEDGKTQKTYTVKVNRVRTDDARLKELKLKDYEISPEFNKDTYSYTITVPNDKKTFTKDDIEIATPIQTGAVVSYDNDLSLSTKETNTFNVKVLAADGITKKTYTINIVRTKGSSIKTNSLTPSTGTLDPTFSADTDTYSLTLGNDDNYLSFDVTTEDDQAVVTGNDEQEVPDGESTRTITITSEDGTNTKTYTINVNRIRTDDARLKELTLNSNYTLDKTFDKDTYEYTVTVPSDTLTFAKSDVLTAVPLWDTASVTLDDDLSNLEQRTTKPYKITITSANGTQKVYTLNVHCAIIPDTNAYLKSLATSEGTLDPTFDKDVTNYTVTVEGNTDKLTISAEPESEYATVEGTGEVELTIGNNTKQIIVTAEDGTTKLYQVTIKRKSNDARLKSLKIRNYEFDQEFDQDKYEYTLTVPNDKFQTTAEEFEAKPLYSTTEITNDGTIELSTLEVNTYHIYTKSEDGTDTKTYTIKITRQKSSDSKLSKLAVEGCELTETFDPDKTTYTAYVPKGTESFDTSKISYTTRDEYAVATPSTTGTLDLAGGKHKYTISVTSQDGTTTTLYTLNVDYEPSHNAYLKSLTVNDGKVALSPEFSRDVTEYSVSLRNKQSQITINAEAEDPYATIVDGTGTFDITQASTQILVKVKAEDGKYRIYILNVTKDMTPVTTISGTITTENVNKKYEATIKLYKSGTETTGTTGTSQETGTSTTENKTTDTTQTTQESGETQPLKEVETGEDGKYEFDVEAGTYDVVIEKAGYLKYTLKNIEISEGDEIDLGENQLIAGDINQDGEIEISDLVGLNDNVGTTITDDNKSQKAKYDFNEDGTVDDSDRKILKANYGELATVIDVSTINKTEE